jgi:type IV secretion system protein VirB8
MNREPALEAYFEEAASWDADRVRRAARSERRAWWVAGAACAAVVLLAIALMLLTPLKRVTPFLIRVDRSTGIVDSVPVYAGKEDFSAAVTRYFLDQYVTVCERFDFATAESDYEECGALNAPARNQVWYSKWARTNPASPLNRYKDGTTVSAQVVAITLFRHASGMQDLAQVRYMKVVRPAGGSGAKRSYWIATIEYTYTKPSSDPRDRAWNPLGFKVLTFKADPEVMPEPPAGAAGTGGAS